MSCYASHLLGMFVDEPKKEEKVVLELAFFSLKLNTS
jgi:hypothetical protein